MFLQHILFTSAFPTGMLKSLFRGAKKTYFYLQSVLSNLKKGVGEEKGHSTPVPVFESPFSTPSPFSFHTTTLSHLLFWNNSSSSTSTTFSWKQTVTLQSFSSFSTPLHDVDQLLLNMLLFGFYNGILSRYSTNWQDTTKARLERKFIALNAYTKKESNLKLILTSHLKTVGKKAI